MSKNISKRWMQIIIGFTFFGAVVLSFVRQSYADEIRGPIQIQPICVLNGPVYLEFTTRNNLVGYVGKEWLELSVRGNRVSGQVNDHDVQLMVEKNTIHGTVNNLEVEWRVTRERDVVFGYQPCLLAPVKN